MANALETMRKADGVEEALQGIEVRGGFPEEVTVNGGLHWEEPAI